MHVQGKELVVDEGKDVNNQECPQGSTSPLGLKNPNTISSSAPTSQPPTKVSLQVSLKTRDEDSFFLFLITFQRSKKKLITYRLLTMLKFSILPYHGNEVLNYCKSHVLGQIILEQWFSSFVVLQNHLAGLVNRFLSSLIRSGAGPEEVHF